MTKFDILAQVNAAAEWDEIAWIKHPNPTLEVVLEDYIFWYMFDAADDEDGKIGWLETEMLDELIAECLGYFESIGVIFEESDE